MNKMRVRWALFFVCAAALAGDAERDFARARELMQQGKEAQALVSFTDFLRRHRSDARAAEAQYAIGEVFYRQRNYGEAINELQKVFALQKKNEETTGLRASLLIGQAQLRLGQIAAARIEWEAVYRRAPTTPEGNEAKNYLMGLDPETEKK